MYNYDLAVLFFKENMNLVCGPEYAITTRNAMAQLSERETSFEIIEVCLFIIQFATRLIRYLPPLFDFAWEF